MPGGVDSWKLDTHGFCFMKGLPPISCDLEDRLATRLQYLPLLAERARQAAGAEAAYVTNYILRNEFAIGYNTHCHSDFGPWSEGTFRKMLMERYKVPAAEVETKELLMANVWHPYHLPAYTDPLCLMDMSSVVGMTKGWEKTSVVRLPTAIDQLEGLGDEETSESIAFYRSGWFYENQSLRSDDGLLAACPYRPTHRFVFCPDMHPDEACLFKQWDSREEVDAKCCFHSSMHDTFHDKDPSYPPRRSLECRLVLTFPKEPKAPASSKL